MPDVFLVINIFRIFTSFVTSIAEEKESSAAVLNIIFLLKNLVLIIR